MSTGPDATAPLGPVGPVTSDLSTPHGPARMISHAAVPGEGGSAVLLLSHGAGAGIETHDLTALAAELPAQGIDVVLLEQPWRVAGRRIATAPDTLDDALLAAVAALPVGPGPLVVGGRSAGARSAARCATRAGAVGCLALSFPLHPPGRPERSRRDELAGSGVPTLVVQGERDPMGRPEEFGAEELGEEDAGWGVGQHVELAVVPAADHSLRVTRASGLTEADVAAIVVESTLEWLTREVLGP